MLVEVTQEHINQGFVDSCDSCPIALAMQDKDFENVQVYPWYISYDQLQFDFTTINNDSLIRKWIFDFDGGEEVFPIQIEINKEARYAKLVE